MKQEPPIPVISGIDTAKGIAMTGGTVSGYCRVLSMFCKDVRERLQMLRLFLFESATGGNKFPEKRLPSFITQVHSLKSACATIGAADISGQAARLKAAGQTGDMAFIQENISGFVEHLTELVKNIRVALELLPGEVSANAAAKSGGPDEGADISRYLSLFNKLAEALKSGIVADIDRYLDELNELTADSKTKEILETISDQILMTEFSSAIKTIEDFIDTAQ